MKQSNSPNKTRIIGITGNSGSGKTTVAQIITAKGGLEIDADRLAHQVMEPGRAAYDDIVKNFGKEILNKDGHIDRKKLGAIVFSKPEKRTQLEAIVHPLVIQEIRAKIAASNESVITVDAVLLVESGLHHHCDALWLVTAKEETRLARITTRDKLDHESANARMRNQRDTAPIAAIADVIIHNEGDLSQLESQVAKYLC